MDNKVIYFFGSLIVFLLGLTIYSIFFGSRNELDSALKDLKNAQEEMIKTQQNLDSILIHTQYAIDQNENFKNYIHATDSIVKSSEAKSRNREIKYLQTLGILERNIRQMKADLAKLKDQLPEPENGELSNH